MASVDAMNDEELGKVLAALPGTSEEEVERLCARVIAAGGSTDDKGLVASDDGFEAFLALFGGMAARSTFCARLFEGTTQPHQLPRAALVARVRWVIETLTRCSMQWWRHLIVEFAGSTDPARLAEAAALLQKSDAYCATRVEIKGRVDELLTLAGPGPGPGPPSPDAQALADRAADDIEVLWTLLLAQLCSKNVGVFHPTFGEPADRSRGVLGLDDESLAHCEAAVARCVEAGSLDAAAFCRARGAELAATFDGGEGSYPSNHNTSLLNALLAPDGPGKRLLDVWPDAMLRLFLANRRRLLGEASPGMVNTSLDAFMRVVHPVGRPAPAEIDEAAFARACALTTDEPACGPALSSQSQSVLRECALNPELRVRWDDDGQAVPHDWGSRGQWSQMYAPRARDALLATELFTVGRSPASKPKRTNAEYEELFAEALEFFSGCSWFLASNQLHNSMHCMPSIRRHVLEILTSGLELNPERFSGYWGPVMGVSTPYECSGGYEDSMFSANCLSCGMPPVFCPSLARLQAELGDWANAIENAACPSAISFEEVRQLSLNALKATAFTMRGNGTMHPGPPSPALVAIGDFVASGLATNHYKKRGFHGQFALPRRIDIPPKGAAVGATGRLRLRVSPAAQWSPNTHLQWPPWHRDAIRTTLLAGARCARPPPGDVPALPELPPEVWWKIFTFWGWYAFDAPKEAAPRELDGATQPGAESGTEEAR